MDPTPIPFVPAQRVLVNRLPGGDRRTRPVELRDTVIRAEYPRFGTPVDRIVSDPDLGAEFAALVKARIPADGRIDVAQINWRLITLCKHGEDNGGLPRLQRAYYGRETKQPRAPKPR